MITTLKRYFRNFKLDPWRTINNHWWFSLLGLGVFGLSIFAFGVVPWIAGLCIGLSLLMPSILHLSSSHSSPYDSISSLKAARLNRVVMPIFLGISIGIPIAMTCVIFFLQLSPLTYTAYFAFLTFATGGVGGIVFLAAAAALIIVAAIIAYKFSPLPAEAMILLMSHELELQTKDRLTTQDGLVSFALLKFDQINAAVPAANPTYSTKTALIERGEALKQEKEQYLCPISGRIPAVPDCSYYFVEPFYKEHYRRLSLTTGKDAGPHTQEKLGHLVVYLAKIIQLTYDIHKGENPHYQISKEAGVLINRLERCFKNISEKDDTYRKVFGDNAIAQLQQFAGIIKEFAGIFKNQPQTLLNLAAINAGAGTVATTASAASPSGSASCHAANSSPDLLTPLFAACVDRLKQLMALNRLMVPQEKWNETYNLGKSFSDVLEEYFTPSDYTETAPTRYSPPPSDAASVSVLPALGVTVTVVKRTAGNDELYDNVATDSHKAPAPSAGATVKTPLLMGGN